MVFLVILYYVDQECGRFERFEETTCNISLNRDISDNQLFQKFCETEYADQTQVQLLGSIHKSNDKDEKDMLRRIYRLKKDSGSLNIPCVYKLTNLGRDKYNSISGERYNPIYMGSYDNSFGSIWTWANCRHSNQDIPDTKNNIYYNNNEIRFLNTDFASIKGEICSRPSFFLRTDSNILDLVDSKFLCIECGVEGDQQCAEGSNIEDCERVYVKRMRVKIFKEDGTFEESEDFGTEFIKNFLSMTYTHSVVKYIPHRSLNSIAVFDRDLCDKYSFKGYKDTNFDLGMVGIDSIMVSRHLRGIKMEIPPPFYPGGYTMERDVDYGNLELNLRKYNDNILKDFKKQYELCNLRKETQINGMAQDGYDVRTLERELREIKKFLELLQSYMDNEKGIDVKLETRENAPYRYCKYSVSNPADIKIMFDNLSTCRSSLDNRRVNLEGKMEKNKNEEEKLRELEGTLRDVDNIINFIDENKLRRMNSIPPIMQSKLSELKGKIGNKCNTVSDNTYTIRTVRRKLDRVKMDIGNSRITDRVLKEYDADRMDNEPLRVMPYLLPYFSNDNTLYISI